MRLLGSFLAAIQISTHTSVVTSYFAILYLQLNALRVIWFRMRWMLLTSSFLSVWLFSGCEWEGDLAELQGESGEAFTVADKVCQFSLLVAKKSRFFAVAMILRSRIAGFAFSLHMNAIPRRHAKYCVDSLHRCCRLTLHSVLVSDCRKKFGCST